MLTRMASVRLQTLGLRFLHFVVILAMVLPNGALFTRTAQAASAEQIAETMPAPTETEDAETTPDPAIGAGEDITTTMILTPTEAITITPTATLTPTLELATEEPTQEPGEELATPTATVTVTETSLKPTATITPTVTVIPTATLTPTVTLTPTAKITPTPTITTTNAITMTDIFTVSQDAFIALPLRGGKVVGFGGAVTVTFPTQSEKLSVWMRTPAEESAPAFSLSGNPFEIVAQGQESKKEITQFSKPLTITVSYDPESLWGDESGLSLYYYDPEVKDWHKIPSVVDQEKNLIIANSDHLTVFDYNIQTWQSAQLPSIEGFQVAQQTGAATYAMSLWTPPGPGGLQPELNLSYNSQVVDSALKDTQASWVGMGWSLDTGYIERNMYGTDYVSEDDTFTIVAGGVSGMLLKDASYSTNGLYHTADETFWRIKYDSTADTWKAWDKNGTIYEFTHKATYPFYANPPIGPQCNRNGDRTWRWSLTKVTNKFGIYLTYTYATETKTVIKVCGDYQNGGTVITAVYPSTITYPNGRYQIMFLRTSRTDYKGDWVSRTADMVLFQRSLLTNVVVIHDIDGNGTYDQWIRNYAFTYASNHPIFPGLVWDGGGYTPALSQITEYGLDNSVSLPATTFTYGDGQHLTHADNGYGGVVDFSYERWDDLDSDNARTYRQNSACQGTGTGEWQGGTYKACIDGSKLLFKGQIYHSLPSVFFRPGGNYIIQTSAISRPAPNTWGTYIGAGFQIGSSSTSWAANQTLPTYINNSMGSVFSIPVDSGYLGANIWLSSDGAQMDSMHVHLLPTRYRVVTKTVTPYDNGPARVTTYRYDEAAMNDADHSHAVAAYSNEFVEPYQEFRGHAMVQEIGPAGSDNSQRVTTTFYHQDDVKKGKSHTTLVSNQSFFDDFETKNTTNWTFNSTSGSIDSFRYQGDGALKIYNPSTEFEYGRIIRQGNPLQDSGTNPNMVITQFKLNDANTNGWILLKSPDEATVWGIIIFGTTLFAYHGNSTTPLTTNFKKNSWYTLQLGVDDQQMLIQIWERDDPKTLIKFTSTNFPGIQWRFNAASNSGTLWLDSYSEGRLYNVSQTLYGYQGFAMGAAPVEGAGTNIYTGLGITWTYLITETMLDYGGDSQFIGAMTRSDYNASEQNGTQYGNLTRQVKSEWNGSAWADYTLIRRKYYPYTSDTKYLVGFPAWQNDFKCPAGTYSAACSINYYNPSAADVIGQTLYYYDNQHSSAGLTTPPSSGILTYQKKFLYYSNPGSYSGQQYHDTKYIYDTTWGNQTSVTEYSDVKTLDQFEGSGAQTTTTTYNDSTYHTFATSVTNALNQTISWTNSYTACVPHIEIGPNGAATKIEAYYDKFGRITKLVRPGDGFGSPTMTFSYNDGEPFYTTVRQQIAGGNFYTLSKFYDGLGEVRQTQVLSGTQDIVVDYVYDAYGNVKNQSVPYMVAHGTSYQFHTPDTGKPQTMTVYDVLGRVKSVTPPTTSESTFYYYDDSNTSYPTMNKSTIQEGINNPRYMSTFTDVWGRARVVWPKLNPGITYEYDYYDRLKQASKGGATTTLTYDFGGRKKQMVDSDMGTWNYTYDALGNLKTQTDARNCRTSLYYDVLNRLTNKNYSADSCPTTNNVTYGYDGGTYGKGYRTSMSNTSSSSTWTIDERGRTTQEIKTINGSGNFKTLWSYNSADLVASMTYPSNNSSGSGEVVNYTYNSRMLNYSVIGSNTYLQSATYDAANRIDYQSLNGTLINDYTYNNWGVDGGRLSSINSGTTGTPTSIQNLVYDYDVWGNLSTISDYIAGSPQVQSFTYDNLNRITSAQATSGSGGNGDYSNLGANGYSYDSNSGNLSSKGGLAYTYNASVTCAAGTRTIPHAVSTAGSNTYSYDCNGNQISRIGSTYSLAYDAENRLTTVSGAATAVFTYDGDGNRVKGVSGGKTTYYINPSYEVEKPDTLSLSVQNTSSGTNSYTYRTFDNTTTYTIQTGDVLEVDVFLDSNNPQYDGGFDAVLSTSGTVRDHTAWVDQNGYSIHPAASMPVNARGQWYHRTFNIGNKAGETLSNFKIAYEGDAPGYYVILLDNIKITNNGTVKKVIYTDGFPLTSLQAEGPTSGIAFQTTLRSTSYYSAGTQRVALRRAGYTDNNGVKWIFSDHLGSTSKVASSTGTVSHTSLYKAWGETRYTSGTSPTTYKYTGQREEASFGLYYYGARWYDPALGRFVQADSIVPEASQGVQAWDRYAYVNNNPLKYNDPSGHWVWIAVGAAVGAAIGYGVQVANNYNNGLTGSDAWTQNISGEKIIGSAFIGAGVAIFAPAAAAAAGDLLMGAGLVAGGAEGTAVGVGFGTAGVTMCQASQSLSDIIYPLSYPELEIDSGSMPNIAQNIQNAQSNGAPSILTRTTNPAIIAANRTAATAGFTGTGSPDEYPFASTYEGGAGASVSGVPVQEQWVQGGVLSSFYQSNNIVDGGKFIVKVK